MTYCVGMLTENGMVLIADTRTNAGIDNISVFKKLHMLVENEERLIVVASAGSLSVTQNMLSSLEEGLPGDTPDAPLRTLHTVPTMFRAAQLVGEAVSAARRSIGMVLAGTTINAGVSMLLGGRIGDGPLKLYLIYDEGNFIECNPDAPFLQIGELKYGKPILDRTLTWDTQLDEAVKVGLISFDSTMRSNLSVGRPLDLIVVPSDRAKDVLHVRVGDDDAYFNMLSREWGRLLTEARDTIADPPFMLDPEGV
ncbi:MAG: peptidase [Alphaproteobacteria bacterium]|nr:peptidase [Alphaproteobacteria bacterium]MDE2340157.1 peptidase [Alphaproteobacteria bacterium]